MDDLISRKRALEEMTFSCGIEQDCVLYVPLRDVNNHLKNLPSVQRYTKEELRVFQHGISLSLLSKRSAQYWKYDEDTATEIKFLERLYKKVVADMRGEQE